MLYRFLLRIAPIVMAALLLPACQPLPHPFEANTPPPTSPILSPPDAAGIVVQAVTGAPAPAGEALTTAMVAALQKEDVPADADAGNQRSYRLAGTVAAQPNGDRVRVSVVWRLNGPDGHAVASENAASEVAAAAWRAGDAEMAKALVAQSAAALVRHVEGDVPVEHVVKAALLGIAPVTGASGDGGRALSMAIAAALHHAGVALQDKPGDKPSYVLAGSVALEAAKAGHQQVKIVWALTRADGKEIGRVSQENAVPAGSLDGKWGETAYDVAVAATPGIVELLQRAQAAGT